MIKGTVEIFVLFQVGFSVTQFPPDIFQHAHGHKKETHNSGCVQNIDGNWHCDSHISSLQVVLTHPDCCGEEKRREDKKQDIQDRHGDFLHQFRQLAQNKEDSDVLVIPRCIADAEIDELDEQIAGNFFQPGKAAVKNEPEHKFCGNETQHQIEQYRHTYGLKIYIYPLECFFKSEPLLSEKLFRAGADFPLRP